MFKLSTNPIITLSWTVGGFRIRIGTLFKMWLNEIIGNGLLEMEVKQSVNEIIGIDLSLLK